MMGVFHLAAPYGVDSFLRVRGTAARQWSESMVNIRYCALPHQQHQPPAFWQRKCSMRTALGNRRSPNDELTRNNFEATDAAMTMSNKSFKDFHFFLLCLIRVTASLIARAQVTSHIAYEKIKKLSRFMTSNFPSWINHARQTSGVLSC